MRYEQYKIMQDIREIEFRDSGSNTNNKIYFEVRTTAIRPRLHTEGFPLHPHRTSHKGNLHRGIWNYKVVVCNSSLQHNHLYTRGIGTKPKHNHLYTRGTRHKAKPQSQSPLHKRDKDKAKIQSPLHKRDKPQI